MRALQGRSADVVLVGHSLAGHTIPLVAVRRPVRALVYLCALVPVSGQSLRQQIKQEPEMFVSGFRDGLEVIDDHGTLRWRDGGRARATFYADCTEEVADRAVVRLRPQATTAYSQACPLNSLPDLSSTYVVCTEDRAINPQWSRRKAASMAASLVEVPGGHSPFLSRPETLASVLTTVVESRSRT